MAITAASAQVGIRNISSVGVDANFDGTLALDINQVVLFPVVSWLSGEVKVQRQDTPVLRETTISVAPIFIVGRSSYYIVRYGLGIGDGPAEAVEGDDGRSISHELTVDANYETEAIYANLAVRGSYYPADEYWFVLPTAAARFPLGARASLLGRYFFSYNSTAAASHALLADLGYGLTERVSVKVGLSGSVELTREPGAGEGDPRRGEWELTGITGLTYAVTPALSLRYHLEYLGRFGEADGIRNIVVLDASF